MRKDYNKFTILNLSLAKLNFILKLCKFKNFLKIISQTAF